MIIVPLILLLVLVLTVVWITAEQKKANTITVEVGPDGFIEIWELAGSKVEIEKVNDQTFIIRSVE